MARPGHVDVAALSAAIERESDVPLLSSVLRFVDRPAAAVRSLIAGDAGAAGRHLAQFALDLPTGGFLDRRLSLANLFSDTGDLTTRRDQHSLGFVGDVLTDPLTYVTLGGGGLAKGALTGLGREAAASRLAAALLETSAGKAALQGVDVAARPAALEQLFRLPAGGLERLAPEAADQLAAQALERGLVVDRGALRLGETALVPDIWGKLGAVTAPSLAMRGLGAVAPEAAQAIRTGARDAIGELAATFYDRTLSGVVPESVRRAVLEARGKAGLRALEGQHLARELSDLAPPAELQELGRRLLGARDDFAKQAAGKSAAERRSLADEIQARIEAGLSPGGVAALRRWQAEVKRSHGELVKAGVDLPDNPFYVPRQLRDEVRAALPKGDLALETPGRKGAKGAFLRRSEHRSVDDWLASVQQQLQNAGASADEVSETLAAARALPAGELAETDLAKLALRYGDEAGQQLGRLHVQAEAKRLGVRQGDAVDRYIQAQWDGVQGKPHAVRRALELVNRYFKPAATVVWPSYHVRNALSAVMQTALDPDLTLADGVQALLRALRNAPALARAGKLGVDDDTALLLMRAAEGGADSPAALQALSGMTIAGRPGRQVIEGLMGAVSRAGGEADLFESASTLQRLGRDVPAGPGGARAALQLPAAYTQFAYRAANYVEQTFRTHNYLALLAKGVDPADAAKRVNKIFVDYSTQSAADKVLRDWVPFVRFPLAMTPVVAESFARRPGGLASQLVRHMDRQQRTEADAIPDPSQRGLRLPLGGGQYLGSLGLPHEAAGQLLEAIPTPGRGFAGVQRFAAGLAPAARLPMEATANRSFFSGDEFGVRRRAPGGIPLPGFLGGRTVETPDGRQVRELPGWMNELMGALPTGRFTATVDSLLREDAELIDQAVRLTTGVNVVKVDQRRVAARVLARHFDQLVKQGKIGEAQSHYARLAAGERLPPELRDVLEAEQALKAERKRR